MFEVEAQATLTEERDAAAAKCIVEVCPCPVSRVPRPAVPCCVVLCSAVLCCAMLCCAKTWARLGGTSFPPPPLSCLPGENSVTAVTKKTSKNNEVANHFDCRPVLLSHERLLFL